ACAVRVTRSVRSGAGDRGSGRAEVGADRCRSVLGESVHRTDGLRRCPGGLRPGGGRDARGGAGDSRASGGPAHGSGGHGGGDADGRSEGRRGRGRRHHGGRRRRLPSQGGCARQAEEGEGPTARRAGSHPGHPCGAWPNEGGPGPGRLRRRDRGCRNGRPDQAGDQGSGPPRGQRGGQGGARFRRGVQPRGDPVADRRRRTPPRVDQGRARGGPLRPSDQAAVAVGRRASVGPDILRAMRKGYLFSSESVTEGHPDKLADQISDAVLDAILAVDGEGRVACETLVTTGIVMVAGEITTSEYVDIPSVVRRTVLEIGYTDANFGIDGATCGVLTSIQEQSPDIARGVEHSLEERMEGSRDDLDALGAGDQGMMFGYACRDTDELMPMSIAMAHRLTKRLADVRKAGVVPYLRPDGKSQVTIEYRDGTPVRGDPLLISAQHREEVDADPLPAPDVRAEVIDPVLREFELAAE